MSRAFVNEDAGGSGPRRDYHLPERDDPSYDAVAAGVLLEAARVAAEKKTADSLAAIAAASKATKTPPRGTKQPTTKTKTPTKRP